MRPRLTTHVDDEDFVRLACNELNAAETAAVMEHLEDCEDCREVWAAVERMRGAAVEFDAGAIETPNLRPQSKPLKKGWIGLAAAAVLVVFVVGPLRWVETPSSDDLPVSVVRSGPTSAPVPVLPHEGSQVTEPSFSWSEAEGPDSYSVELLGSDGELLWQSTRQEGTVVAWPRSVDPRVGTYYWRVLAHYPDGEEPISSPLVSFEIVLP